MQVKNVVLNLEGSRRPSKLGDGLAKDKIEKARQLTPEQRLLVALELADAATALNTHVPRSFNEESLSS